MTTLLHAASTVAGQKRAQIPITASRTVMLASARPSTSAQRLRLFAELGIDARQLAAGALGGEHPLHAGAGGVALLLPGLYLGEQPFAFADTPVEALGAQDAISISTMLSQLACFGV